jgi:hypothetical protein
VNITNIQTKRRLHHGQLPILPHRVRRSAETRSEQANKWFKGENPADCAFDNQQQMLDAMRRPEYESDPEFRKAVAIMVANSTFGTNHNESVRLARKADARRVEDQAIVREQVNRMFGKKDVNGDLLYEKSPTYRREVENYIRANSDALDAAMPNLVSHGTRMPKMRVQLTSDHAAEVQAGLAKEREAKREAAKKSAIAEAERRSAAPYIDALTGEASDE